MAINEINALFLSAICAKTVKVVGTKIIRRPGSNKSDKLESWKLSFLFFFFFSFPFENSVFSFHPLFSLSFRSKRYYEDSSHDSMIRARAPCVSRSVHPSIHPLLTLSRSSVKAINSPTPPTYLHVYHLARISRENSRPETLIDLSLKITYGCHAQKIS